LAIKKHFSVVYSLKICLKAVVHITDPPQLGRVATPFCEKLLMTELEVLDCDQSKALSAIYLPQNPNRNQIQSRSVSQPISEAWQFEIFHDNVTLCSW